MKKIGVGFVSAITFVIFAFLLFSYIQFHFIPLGSSDETFLLDVPPGSTFQSLRKTLDDKGFHIPFYSYRFWLKTHKAASKLKIGEYLLKKNWAPVQVLQEILSGHPLLHKMIVKEGYNVYDIQSEFQKNIPELTPEAFSKLLSKPSWLQRMGVPTQEFTKTRIKPTLEGFLFPETYAFQKYAKTESLFEDMLKQFEQRALPILSQHPFWGQSPEGRYKLLILASIIEKESGQATEQPLIASVFWNRIQKKMKLQSDPTTIYGLLPAFDGNLTRANLHAPTPYNTYTVPSLPIAPISNPGESALKAVINPEISNYLFFVAKGDGTHVFSPDYKTHEKFVRIYQLGGK